MKRLIPIGALLCLVSVIFIGQRSQAIPLDVPYGTSVVAVSTNNVTLTTATFTTTNYQWCIEHVTVSSPNAQFLFTIYSSTNNPPLNTATTNYAVVSSTNFVDVMWSYRQPLCNPANTNVTLQTNVVGSTISYQAYTWKGWNP